MSIIESPPVPKQGLYVHQTVDRKKAYEEVVKQLEQDRQAYIILPVKNGKDLLGLKEALHMAGVLGREFLEGFKIGVYCSEMKKEERLRVFDDFQRRRIDVLFCTSCIEDAPMVGNANSMIIEFADKHGLMRLHRLRRHISRSHYPSNCQLILSENTLQSEQIDLVCAEKNGFMLAEKVAEVNTFPLQQMEGVPLYAWNSQNGSRELRLLARKAAYSLASKDLYNRRWPLLLNSIQQWWGERFPQLPKPKKQVYKRKRRRKRRGR